MGASVNTNEKEQMTDNDDKQAMEVDKMDQDGDVDMLHNASDREKPCYGPTAKVTVLDIGKDRPRTPKSGLEFLVFCGGVHR